MPLPQEQLPKAYADGLLPLQTRFNLPMIAFFSSGAGSNYFNVVSSSLTLLLNFFMAVMSRRMKRWL